MFVHTRCRCFTPIAGERIAAILGYRCSGSSAQWQFQIIDTDNNTAATGIPRKQQPTLLSVSSDTNATMGITGWHNPWFTVPGWCQ
ncbi:MAG: hypothetical protein Q9P01_11530 [Anaerolineae bacterium]|nr:hypothetical protein [Anaerolineae bacterium]